MMVNALIHISGIKSQITLKTKVILRKNTTWKCGKIQRLIINYLRELQHGGCTQASVKDLLKHLKLNKTQKEQLFEAMERLEKRGIIIVFKPFSTPNKTDARDNKGGI